MSVDRDEFTGYVRGVNGPSCVRCDDSGLLGQDAFCTCQSGVDAMAWYDANTATVRPLDEIREAGERAVAGVDDLALRMIGEDRLRRIVREEITAYFRRARTQTIGGGSLSYRDYLRDRDEPPAAPPIRVVMPTPNTTERL